MVPILYSLQLLKHLWAATEIASMSEKKVDELAIGVNDADYGVGNVHEATGRKGSAVDPAVVAAEIFDERYETTQRGLKSR